MDEEKTKKDFRQKDDSTESNSGCTTEKGKIVIDNKATVNINVNFNA